jgi:hypothetical protein
LEYGYSEFVQTACHSIKLSATMNAVSSDSTPAAVAASSQQVSSDVYTNRLGSTQLSIVRNEQQNVQVLSHDVMPFPKLSYCRHLKHCCSLCNPNTA